MRKFSGLLSNQRYIPSTLVAVNAICINTRPGASVRTPNSIQLVLDPKKATNPHPEWALFNARSDAPIMPKAQPIHCKYQIISSPISRSALVTDDNRRNRAIRAIVGARTPIFFRCLRCHRFRGAGTADECNSKQRKKQPPHWSVLPFFALITSMRFRQIECTRWRETPA